MKFEEYKRYVVSTITVERDDLAYDGDFGMRRLELLVQLRKAEAAATCDQLTDIMEAIH